jgi:hypothetical protein
MKENGPQKQASHPWHCHATPRHQQVLEAQHDGPRAQAANAIDRSSRGPFSARPPPGLRSAFPPPYAGARVLLGPRAAGRRTNGPIIPCMHPATHDDDPPVSSRRGRARTTRPAGQAHRIRIALHVMWRQPSTRPTPWPMPPRRSHRHRRLVPDSHGQNGAKGRERTGRRVASQGQANKQSGCPFPLPLLPLGLWQSVRSLN